MTPSRTRVLLALAAVGAAVPAARAASPAVDYALNCQGCHRADGNGTPGSVPALADSVGRFLRIPGGREYLVQVPGVAQAPLDDAATAGVLNWIIQRFDRAGAPADFAPYTAAEVARLRRQPLTDVDAVRERLLRTLAPQVAEERVGATRSQPGHRSGGDAGP